MTPVPPPVVLTCGEPAGIGPELAIRAWEALRGEMAFFLIGDPRHLPVGAPVAEIAMPSEAGAAMARGLPVLPHAFGAPARAGIPDPANAADVVAVIARAVSEVQAGRASALCTGPIHKQALAEGAGFAFPGHTEYLAHLAGGMRPVMMLVGGGLRVVPVTIHVPLAEVPQKLSAALLEETLRITVSALSTQFGIEMPRLAVAGLNPHAGEGGILGREEIDIIAPVCARLRAEGYAIRGPLSADTMFHDAARDSYDAAICMYHDQALIPLKTLAFSEGVNVTLGLPFSRTSPDHGTALDIAGTGAADPASTIAALRLARDLGARRPRP